MFGVTAVPALLFFILMFFVPESPRWLVKNGRSSQARGVLKRIGGGAFADQEVANIEATLVGEIEKVNFRDLLEPKVLWIVTFGAILAVLQQWCGMNVIFYYAVKLFGASGDTVSDALLKIVSLGMVNAVFTVIAVATVDRIGRRILMLFGFIGLAVIHTLLGLAFFCGAGGNYILVLVAGGDGRLRADDRAGGLGRAGRNLPQPHPRRGVVDLGVLAVDGLLHPDFHLPAAGGAPRQGMAVLDLRRDLRLRIPVYRPILARNQRQDPGGDRAGTGGLNP